MWRNVLRGMNTMSFTVVKFLVWTSPWVLITTSKGVFCQNRLRKSQDITAEIVGNTENTLELLKFYVFATILKFNQQNFKVIIIDCFTFCKFLHKVHIKTNRLREANCRSRRYAFFFTFSPLLSFFPSLLPSFLPSFQGLTV